MRLMRFPATALCRAWNCSIPVATIGGLNDPAQMEEIIASGKADVVYMARALLADPFLPRKVMENRSEDIVHSAVAGNRISRIRCRCQGI